ncbi:antibiotic biosynthesis monooxygenase [Budviciaceae bacterium BWR-B9]|uniref:Antibiotic biosynthesis monooxygenase n=1 Tax=Limnobaculum allomyrinae TaxID=2791986 RepID=A0ABS1IL22_9GAMM|nr:MULTISPECIES: putative quinol monooxygenase [Limnobaculum]MBK5142434.1 antibiotic biosynthesis monooxygenase [Limnobaculum allomyrinae]MBV7690681.1 antibiotic biosynthesis monooxygenase [Limnobaculum sp. M2-1]
MSEITIVATLTIKADFQAPLMDALKKLVDSSRAEEGCLQYDLHQDNKNPLVYVFIERWASQEILDIHSKSSHFVSFGQFTKGKIESLTINLMSKVY